MGVIGNLVCQCRVVGVIACIKGNVVFLCLPLGVKLGLSVCGNNVIPVNFIAFIVKPIFFTIRCNKITDGSKFTSEVVKTGAELFELVGVDVGNGVLKVYDGCSYVVKFSFNVV